MALKFKDFKQYARKISFVEQKNLNTDYVLSIFNTEKISLLPILDRNQQKFYGYISRKNLLLALLEKKDKPISSIDVKQLVEKHLTILEETDYISNIMDELNQHPAVLIKDKENKIEWVVSPRVAANALEEYSKAFRLIERIEVLIRDVILERNLDFISVFKDTNFNPESPDELSFANYIKIFKCEWNKLDIMEDQDYVVDLMHQCRMYRNDLVHFKTSLDKDRNKKLEVLYGMFLKHFKPENYKQNLAAKHSLN